MKDETKCLHAGYQPKNAEPRVMPIVQSTTYVYDSTEEVAAVFDDPMKSLIYSRFEVHVSDIRTCVLHPASETHRQLTDEQLAAAGIEQGLVRLSVGLENVEDIIADLEQAFSEL